MIPDGSAVEKLQVRCCVAGGGPAGMLLGFLLARAGVDVLVIEKHADFLRDFRGDTLHPSTLEVMLELGLLDDFLRLPHQEVTHLDAKVGDEHLTIGDFSHLPTHCKFLAFMPQWEFLNFLAEHGKQYPAFHLRMQTEATDLIEEGGRTVGLRAKTLQGELEARADLIVSADGRHSTLRQKAGLEIINLGAPMDVLWMRLPKRPGDPGQTLGRLDTGRFLAMLDRGEYWQCAYVIPKGTFDEVRQRGLPWLRDEIARLAPFLSDRMEELRDWDDVKLLTVAVDRLRRWYRPGFLCIGDAAHAMSPVGGVGINLAVQDAVAAANILAVPLRNGAPSEDRLREVQRRREPPTRATQWLQVLIQNRVIRRVLGGGNEKMRLPLALKLFRRWPRLQRIPARVIGLGFRPEHVRTPVVK